MPDIKRRIIIDTKDVDRARDKANELARKLDQIEEGRTKKAQSEARKRINQTREQLKQGLVSERFATRKIEIIRQNLATKLVDIEKRKQRRLDQIQTAANNRAKKAGKEISGSLGAGFASFKAIVGAGIITTATSQIINLGSAALDAAKNFELAEKGLRSTAEGFGRNAEEAIAAAKELSEGGLLSFTQAAQGIKSLLGTGFDVSQALKISKGLVDIGAFNNIVGDLGQSFVDATKGIKCLDASYRIRVRINGADHVLNMGALFQQIEKLESVELAIDQTHYLRKSTLEVPDEKGKFQEVSAIIKKKDEISEITFDDGNTIRVGSLHKFKLNKLVSKLAVDVQPGDVFTLVGGRIMGVQSVALKPTETVFGFQIETDEHLYSTNDGIIHHNTNSIELIENIGITTRLGSALERAGFKQEDLAGGSKKAGAVLALQNIILKDAAKFTGDAAKFAETYAGAQTRLSATTTKFLVSLGEVIKDGLAPFLNLAATVTGEVTALFEAFKNTAAGQALIKIAFAPVIVIFKQINAILSFLVGTVRFVVAGFQRFIKLVTDIKPLNTLVALLLKLGQVLEDFVLAPFRLISRVFKQVQKLFNNPSFGKKLENAVTNISLAFIRLIANVKVAGRILTNFFKIGIQQLAAYGAAITGQFGTAKKLFLQSVKNSKQLVNDIKNFSGESDKEFKRLLKIQLSFNKKAQQLAAQNQKKQKQTTTPTKGKPKEPILTTEQQLKDELAAIRRAQNEKNTIAQEADLRQRAITIEAQIETARGSSDLTALENQRIVDLEALKEKNITAARKKELKERLKLNKLDIAEAKKKLQIQAADEQRFQQLRADLATSFVNFTEKAFLSEKVSFKAFLADSIKLFAKFIADKIKLSALADLADPFTVPIGIAKLAAAGAVQALGSAAATALAPQEKPPELTFDAGTINERLADRIDDLKQPTGGPAPEQAQVVNIDNSVNVSLVETGTYFTESQAIRERIAPLLDEVRVEQGAIQFAG